MSRFVISFSVTAEHQPISGIAPPEIIYRNVYTPVPGGERQMGAPDGTWAQETSRTSLSTRLTEDKHAVLEKMESCPYYGNNDSRIHGVPSMCKRRY